VAPGTSSGSSEDPPEWHPAWRRREPGSGSFVERGRPVAPMRRKKLKREAPARARVPMRGTGTEQSVVGMKAL